jgi:hypothetical protein
LAFEFNEASEHRSKCLKRIYLAELVGEYLKAQSRAGLKALSLNVSSLPRLKGRAVVGKSQEGLDETKLLILDYASNYPPLQTSIVLEDWTSTRPCMSINGVISCGTQTPVA